MKKALVNLVALAIAGIIIISCDAIPKPVIDRIEPPKGVVGEPVVIHGSGFGSAGFISFGSEFIPVTEANGWTATEIRLNVPLKLSPGSFPVSINTGGQTSNSVEFVIDPTDLQANTAMVVSAKGGRVDFINMSAASDNLVFSLYVSDSYSGVKPTWVTRDLQEPEETAYITLGRSEDTGLGGLMRISSMRNNPQIEIFDIDGDITSLAIDPLRTNLLYMGDSDQQLMRSFDAQKGAAAKTPISLIDSSPSSWPGEVVAPPVTSLDKAYVINNMWVEGYGTHLTELDMQLGEISGSYMFAAEISTGYSAISAFLPSGRMRFYKKSEPGVDGGYLLASGVRVTRPRGGSGPTLRGVLIKADPALCLVEEGVCPVQTQYLLPDPTVEDIAAGEFDDLAGMSIYPGSTVMMIANYGRNTIEFINFYNAVDVAHIASVSVPVEGPIDVVADYSGSYILVAGYDSDEVYIMKISDTVKNLIPKAAVDISDTIRGGIEEQRSVVVGEGPIKLSVSPRAPTMSAK